MSDPNTPQPQPVAGQPMAGHPDMPANAVIPTELRLHSHSTIFYWWPVWLFGLIFSLLTYMGGSHMLVVPKNTTMTKADDGDKAKPDIHLIGSEAGSLDRVWAERVESSDKKTNTPKIHMAQSSGFGAIFFTVILIVIFITNVPLRGTLSIIAILGVALVVLLMVLTGVWDDFVAKTLQIHIYLNLAGYLFLSLILLVGWCVAIFFIDRRTFIVFTRGSIRVREEIGGKEKTYDTTGMSVTKLRDDLFRHMILGLGTGDLIVQTFGAEKHEIRMTNIWMIDRYLPIIEQMMKK